MIADIQQAAAISRSGIRLDYMHVGIVIESRLFSRKQWNEMWRGEFDGNGMTRGLRSPMGHAAKAWKKAGDKDIDGNVLTKKEKGR